MKIATANHQRSLLSSSTPRYILDLKTVRSMTEQMQFAQGGLQQYVLGLGGPQAPGQQPNQGQPGPPEQTASQAAAITGPSRPPTQPPHPQQQLQPPQLPQPTAQPLPPPQSTPIPTPASVPSTPSHPQPHPQSTPNPAHAALKGKGNQATSTPPASAATPVASAPTPTHIASSPQAAQSSPKPKATKPKPRRKASTSASKAPSSAPAPPPAPSPAPAASATPSSAAAPTPVDVPTPSSEGGVKRRREEESPAIPPVGEPSPPKKLKTDWEGPVSSQLVKKEQDLDAIKTDEDASKFFDKMSEMLKTNLDAGENQEPWPSQISDTLDQILKAVGDSSDLGESGFSSLLGDTTTGLGLSASPPPSHVSSGLDGFEFFDFTSYSALEGDSDSKAATPDLVTVSSTNPSPGSGSETDMSHAPSGAADTAKIVDPKVDDMGDGSDFLRLGPWKEIDGGESAYYQNTEWKWDTAMPEQTWAFT